MEFVACGSAGGVNGLILCVRERGEKSGGERATESERGSAIECVKPKITMIAVNIRIGSYIIFVKYFRVVGVEIVSPHLIFRRFPTFNYETGN